MAEELKNRMAEGEFIDITDETQCEHWSAEFRVSTDELAEAVRVAGSRVADLRAYFDNRANRR